MTQDSQPRLNQIFSGALALSIIATLIALALYAYLGTFSRYGSDDYCLSAFFLKDHLGSAMIERYNIASSRYTNILFIGLVDSLFGWYNVAILPGLMIFLFVTGLYLFLKEIKEMVRLPWSRWLIFFLSLLLVYFSILQAPDLYQTLYWRAGMTSHFAPVVLIPFFGAFLLRQIRNTKRRSPSLWAYAVCFAIPFVIGGFSEPPTAFMITVLGLGICAVWWSGVLRRNQEDGVDSSPQSTRSSQRFLNSFLRGLSVLRGKAVWQVRRRHVLMLLVWSLLGALTALVVMAVAPANSIRMQTPPPPLPELIERIINYPFYFIVDTFRTLPIPTLVSFVAPALLFYVQYLYSSPSLSQETRRRLVILLFVVLFLTYLCIAAGFAPSAYGQAYPAPRARFIGRVLLTAAFIMEGALLGVLAAQVRFFQSAYLRGLATLGLFIFALYPLRTAWRVSADIPRYREYAVGWDARDAEMRALQAQGVRDLTVRFLSAERTQDLGDHPEFRLNLCASQLYDVDSIVARPMKKPPK